MPSSLPDVPVGGTKDEIKMQIGTHYHLCLEWIIVSADTAVNRVPGPRLECGRGVFPGCIVVCPLVSLCLPGLSVRSHVGRGLLDSLFCAFSAVHENPSWSNTPTVTVFIHLANASKGFRSTTSTHTWGKHFKKNCLWANELSEWACVFVVSLVDSKVCWQPTSTVYF